MFKRIVLALSIAMMFGVKVNAESVQAAKASQRVVVDGDEEDSTEEDGYELDEQGVESLMNMEENAEEVDQELLQFIETNEDAYATWLDITDDPQAFNAKKKKKGKKGKGGSKCVPTKGRILNNCCGMYVRMRLDQRGMIPDGTNLGQAASGFGGKLSKLGFCNQKGKYSPRTAPTNAVLVYTGGRWGHVEIKTPSGYYFGPTNKMPATEWNSKKRNLTGIWLKCK